MPRKVGITTNLDEKKRFWKGKVLGFRDWQVLKVYENMAAAQDFQNWYADKMDCETSPADPDKPGDWYVYRFDYTRTR
jgi:hypothetical protein